ncbi:Utp20p SCDLUD_002542 [Saccharomycodes ludwigii]|uniref:Utp20p n=1 Tax=Saccharomycodes ludwigii TaxID=36035 RepID=UPI001E8B8880|nr:hypothetical protein SCDLUD_002542 [Saccharomycodes ludwigii]KAH3901068.1 hypothetical protein SCDLUD_002542 [Saccharomycodes ludwigii]
MAKQKVTTKGSNKYRYSSFKDRIDDLKIEPAKNLEKRVHDYIETSHFLASFDHWRDVNMSGDYQEFVQEIENKIQTLPQILFHQKEIFESLKRHIDYHNERSLQPLLDLLAQFCHDLGPDFTVFYNDAIKSLISMLDDAINFESSNVFEWGFNCLAYIFKYLSRVLTQDLVPTFNLLFPLLAHKKEYLSRFSAEALSFLIRKTKAKNLSTFLSYVFEKLIETEDSNLYDGLETLLEEALKSTRDTLHSKTSIILGVLLDKVLSFNNKVVDSFLCDILIDILRHGSSENVVGVYDLILKKISEYLETGENQDLDKIVKIMNTLVFAESGRKISDWSAIVAVIEQVLKTREASARHSILPENCAFLFAVVLRNCDVKTLTYFHKRMFDFYLECYSNQFVYFFKLCLKTSKERTFSFSGVKYFQKFIRNHWADNVKKIALFLYDIEEDEELCSKLNLIMPVALEKHAYAVIKNISKFDDESLLDAYVMVKIIQYCDKPDQEVLLGFIEQISNAETSEFGNDVLGTYLSAFKTISKEHYTAFISIFDKLMTSKTQIKTSRYFIEGFNNIVTFLNVIRHEDLAIFFKRDNYRIVYELTENLVLPNPKLRYETLKLIIKMLEIANYSNEIPNFIKSLLIMEEIPQTLQNARDLTFRLRGLGGDFAKSDPNDMFSSIFFKYLFGLLTVRFSPIWDGIYEILPDIYTRDESLVWSLCLRLLKTLDEPYTLDYYTNCNDDEPMNDEVRENWWTVSVKRLDDAIESADTVFELYSNEGRSIIELLKERRGNFEYPQLIRNQALKVLLLFPGLAERNSKQIVPFFFNNKESEDIFGFQTEKSVSAANWTDSDRNLLLKLFASFKNIKSIYKSEEIHQRLCTLLGSRSLEVQKLALAGIFAYKNKVVLKYQDHLNNLLDDTLFKDELTKFLSAGEERIIEDGDDVVIMPLVLRIFFGRAQTPITSGIKKSRKVAILTALPNFKESYIIDFLRLGTEKLNFVEYFENYALTEEDVSSLSLRRMVGFISIVNALFPILGSKFPAAMETVIQPLIFSCAAATYILSKGLQEDNINKVASNVRQQAMRCFYQLFKHYADSLDWSKNQQDFFSLVINPRLPNFDEENLQQPSALLKIITSWAAKKSMYSFLYFEDFSCAKALMKILLNPKAKESVIVVILKFVNSLILTPSEDEQYVDLVALTVSTSLQKLPHVFRDFSSKELVSTAVELLFSVTNAGYIQDNEARKLLVDSLTEVLGEHYKNVASKELVKLLKSLSTIICDFDASWEEVEPVYKSLSSLLRVYVDKDIRIGLCCVFDSIGNKFAQFGNVSRLISDLNAFTTNKMQGYDFERRLPAFKEIIEVEYEHFSELEWLPILYISLFFMNDSEELAIRTNATAVVNSFTRYLNTKDTDPSEAISLMKDVVLPHLRTGLRRKNEDIRNEYISAVSYIVSNSRVFTELNDMKVLLIEGDQEADFFFNVSHVQLHRRQRAIKRLREFASALRDNSIAHYLIPMIENYVFCEDEKYRNIYNETILTIGKLSNFVSWNQYKALFRRYKSMLKLDYQYLKEVCLLLVQVSASLKSTLFNIRYDASDLPCIRNFPRKEIEVDSFIENELYVDISKILAKRDDETIVARIPLSEVLVNLILGLDEDRISKLLPGILTSICQVLRSRSEELRDAVRKNLSQISVILGQKYLSFIVKELKGALTRGSQIHVLSFTVHSVLVSLKDILGHGDMDDCAGLVVNIIMEDIFGSAGREKDAEGYTSKMKEVKHNKSFDTGELVATNISLRNFGSLLIPIKALLMESISLKTQRKLDELLRRYALGLNHNSESSSTSVLKLCYEIYREGSNGRTLEERNRNSKKEISAEEEFFLVNLRTKRDSVEQESSLYVAVLQKFSLDLLRTALTRHSNLVNMSYLEGFMPLLREAIESEDEGVVISALRVFMVLVKIEFSENSEPIFKTCARKVLTIIKDSPSTSSELCQIGLKYLSAFIRYKDIQLKNTALSYVLTRLLPDFNEPNKQGLAFNFLKALVAKHVMLPELYDVMDTVSEIMVANHSEEIRDVSRSVFYQFLVEYDQSRGRLEKKFKFLVSNLEYPSPAGKQSVMELIGLILNKANEDLLDSLSSSFFVSLANVAVNDDSPKCREMATTVISALLKKVGPKKAATIEKYIIAWLKQSSREEFLGFGLRIYKIYLTSIGLGFNKELNKLAESRVKSVIENSGVGSENSWSLLYVALSIFSIYVTKDAAVYTENYHLIWTNVIDCLLYPHPWVRVSASRLVNWLVDNLENFGTIFSDYELQTIAYKIFRQLGAPAVSEALAEVSVKTLVKLLMKWKTEDTKYVDPPKEDVGNSPVAEKYSDCIEFALTKASHIIRSEQHLLVDAFVAKKSMIQLLALMIQILDAAVVTKYSEKIIMALFMYLERPAVIDEKDEELQTLSKECLQFLEGKITVAAFSASYANVKQEVIERRQQRRGKKAVLAVTAPDIAANKKLRKHQRSREKRKHVKDENGYYRKKRRV